MPKMPIQMTESPPRRQPAAIAIATVAVAAMLVGASTAAAGVSSYRAGPDRAFVTPVERSLEGSARSSIGRTELVRKLRRAVSGFGRSAGIWVSRLGTTGTLYSKNATRPFPIASVTKLFTTGAALEKLGPSSTLETEVWSLGEIGEDGVVSGGIVLAGDGDPTLGRAGIDRLASRVEAAGVTRIEGPVMFDEGTFDLQRSVPQTGISGGPFFGSLSGLSYEWGWGASGPLSNPARSAANRLTGKLRAIGIPVTGNVRRVESGAQRSEKIASLSSPSFASLARWTNAPSDNFLAEMLLKVVADKSGGVGTTKRGASIVERFAEDNGARITIENGSGLSRRNRATPRAVGRYISAMALKPDNTLANAFTSSLAVAGQSGTLASRMRGTAAEGRCRGKTGTLNGVSALSGYCRGPAGRVVFSLLFGGRVNTYSAQLAQDRIAAAIARVRTP